MEIFGGFMVMMSIIGLFLAIVWLVMPFVVFAIKGKQDRTLEVLETIEKRLELLEAYLRPVEPEQISVDPNEHDDILAKSPIESVHESSGEKDLVLIESSAEKKDPEASPAV